MSLRQLRPNDDLSLAGIRAYIRKLHGDFGRASVLQACHLVARKLHGVLGRPSLLQACHLFALPLLIACDGAVFAPPQKSQDELRPGSHSSPIPSTPHAANPSDAGLVAGRTSAPNLPRRLTLEDVFFASRDALPVYEDADLSKVLCHLNFGDQLLIRDRQGDSLKLRLDLFARNNRQCPAPAQYGFVSVEDEVEAPGPLSDEVVITEESVPVFSDTVAEAPICHLYKGSKVTIKARRGLTYTQINITPEVCDVTDEGLGIIRDIGLLPLSERYHRHTRLRAFTLARDVAIMRFKEVGSPVVCTLAHGNLILETEQDKALQMPVAANCPADMLTGYFKHTEGMWLEETPPPAP